MAIEFSATSLSADANIEAYYKLENVNDTSAHAFTLTNNGTTAFNAAKFSNGADFGAANSTKSLTRAATLGITGGAITICLWAKLQSEIGSGEWSFAFQESVTNKNGYDITYQYNGGSRQIVFRRLKKGTSQTGPSYSVTMGTTNYYHLALVYDGTNTVGYVNGNSVGSTANSGVGASGTTFDNFAIGASVADNTIQSFASAIVDDCVVFNRALTAPEIAIIAGTGSGASFILNMI